MPGDGRISFTPSPQIAAYLRQLKGMGIYGKKVGDVVNHIVSNEVTRLLENRLLKRLPLNQGSTGADEEED